MGIRKIQGAEEKIKDGKAKEEEEKKWEEFLKEPI